MHASYSIKKATWCSMPPPGDIQIRYAHPISLNRHQLYVVIVANGCGYTQGPFWLPWRIALVGQENQIEDVRFLFSPLATPPLWPPKREYNAVSAIDNEIWQYRTGGNLTIFDKDHGTAEEDRSRIASGSCSQAYGFANYCWWQLSEIGCAYRI